MLDSDKNIEVVDVARDGLEAVEKVKEINPDVITLDVYMPKMDGLRVIKEIMAISSARIVVLTGLTDPEIAVEALHLGAIDLVLKPSGTFSIDLEQVQEELIKKVKAAFMVKRVSFQPIKTRELPASFPSGTSGVVTIGASTGGPKALEVILSSLPSNFPLPILIVQHLPIGFSKALAKNLSNRCQIEVKEAQDNQPLSFNQVLLAPGGYHLTVRKKGKKIVVRLDDSPPVNCVKPSIDKMMKSVAQVYKEKAIGVLLSGMGHDGAQGAQAIKQKGGKILVQDEKSSTVFGIPKSAIDLGCVDKVLPLGSLGEEIVKLTQSFSEKKLS